MNTSATTIAKDSNIRNDTHPVAPSAKSDLRSRSSHISTRFLAHPRFLMAATFVWPTVSLHFDR